MDTRALIERAMRDAGGFVPAAAVEEIAASGTSVEQLMLELIPLAKSFAIPPISNFYVGAVALGASGNLYFGANYEFAGHPLGVTVHAEQAAVAHALSFGERALRVLAVSAPPCGLCRQFLNELTSAATLTILMPDAPPALLPALLPSSFGPADLGVTAALMSPQSHGLTIASPDDPLAAAALRAANASYAPYSESYAGIALRTRDGGVFRGSYVENAAYNPSLAPLQAAIVSLVISGRKTLDQIDEAVLVEVPDRPVSHAAVTRALLASFSSARLWSAAAVPPLLKA